MKTRLRAHLFVALFSSLIHSTVLAQTFQGTTVTTSTSSAALSSAAATQLSMAVSLSHATPRAGEVRQNLIETQKQIRLELNQNTEKTLQKIQAQSLVIEAEILKIEASNLRLIQEKLNLANSNKAALQSLQNSIDDLFPRRGRSTRGDIEAERRQWETEVQSTFIPEKADQILNHAIHFASLKKDDSIEIAENLVAESKALRLKSGETPLFNRILNFKNRDFNFQNEVAVYPNPNSIIQTAIQFEATANEVFFEGQLSEGETLQEWAFQLLDLGTRFVPVVSNVRDAYELVSGKDLFTGAELSALERGFAAMGVFSVVPGGLRKVSVETLKKIGHRFGRSEEIVKWGLWAKYEWLEIQAWVKKLPQSIDPEPVTALLKRMHPETRARILKSREFSVKTSDSLDTISAFETANYYLAWKPGTIAIERTLEAPEKIIRLISDINTDLIKGKKWAISTSEWALIQLEAKSLNRPIAEIAQSRLSLESLPKYFVEIELPKGTKVIEGIAAGLNDIPTAGILKNQFGEGGALQTHIPEGIQKLNELTIEFKAL